LFELKEFLERLLLLIDGEMFSVSSTINCNANDTIRFQYYTTSSGIKIQTPVGMFDNNRGLTFIIREFK